MYAVIETGGKQYRVEVGTELEVELLEVNPGDAITLDRVLLVADGETSAIGRPIVPNASVAAEVVRQMRGEKTISFKYRPKARSRVKKGHRQELTLLRISDIVLDGHSAAADAAKASEARRTERQRLEEAAQRQAAADAALAAKLAPKVEKAPPADRQSKAKASSKAPAQTAAKPAAKAAQAKAPAKSTHAAKADAQTTKPSAAEAKAPATADAKPKSGRSTKKDG
ncbi:MAG: 50S ribosomal protein L21 [Chloroflexi bacterium]|nr:50S ribosomal protein L21 [Chloroflexota bacterium]